MSNQHIGSDFEDFLKEEGIFDEVNELAMKEVVAWELKQAMEKRGVSKTWMASRLHTSRTQITRLLNPVSDVTLATLAKAAKLLDLRPVIFLVESSSVVSARRRFKVRAVRTKRRPSYQMEMQPTHSPRAPKKPEKTSQDDTGQGIDA